MNRDVRNPDEHLREVYERLLFGDATPREYTEALHAASRQMVARIRAGEFRHRPRREGSDA